MNNKEKILDTAIKIFLEYGFNGASISKIIKQSGLSNGTVYHYFKNKDELINSAYLYAKVSVSKYLKENMIINENYKMSILSYWKCYITWALNNPDLIKFFMNFSDSKNIGTSTSTEVSDHFAFLIKLFSNAIEDDVLISVDLEYLLLYTAGAANATIRYLARNKEKQTEDFLESSFKMYWRSVVNI